MSKRAVTFAAILLVVVLALVGAAVFLLRDDPPPDPPPEPEAATVTEPRTRRVDRETQRMDAHSRPWPYQAFLRDIRAVRKPGYEDVFDLAQDLKGAHAKILIETKISLHLENTTVKEAVEHIAELMKPHGIKVWTGPPYLEGVRFDLHADDQTAQEIWGQIHQKTDSRIFQTVLPQGYCIGTEHCIQQARMDDKQWRRKERAKRVRPENADFLQKEYRPDYQDAHVGAVARDITEKTGVETIVGRELWGKAVRVTWRSAPVPLETALDSLCEELEAHWYVKDGRVFLLDR